MKKIVITGSRGVIGCVLVKGLRNYEITPMDLPENDVRDYNDLIEIFPGHHAVIHLAWDTKNGNWKSSGVCEDNRIMYENVYNAALESGVGRIIMASSVHVDKYLTWKRDHLMGVSRRLEPDSPYGRQKILMEKMGKRLSKKGLEVVCVRFGGVSPLGQMWDDAPVVGLSHPDCVSLVKRCLEVESIPENFLILYGVSNNKKRIHDISNPLVWKPKLDAFEFYSKFIK
jgi:UDP-glucose 4-epimerase